MFLTTYLFFLFTSARNKFAFRETKDEFFEWGNFFIAEEAQAQSNQVPG